MSKYFSQQEENFWPCVSDMFLALFIIALALFSQVKNSNEKGDIRQEKLMADETCRLIEALAEAFPDDDCISSLTQKLEQIREQHSNSTSCNLGKDCEMNKALTQLPQSQSVQFLLERRFDADDVPGKDDLHHSNAVNYFYEFVIPEGASMNLSDDERLSQAHQKILRSIVRNNEDRIKTLSDSKDKDKSELLRRLADAQAASMKKDRHIEQIEGDKKNLQTEIYEKDRRIAAINQADRAKDKQLVELKERLSADMRPRIMDNLREIIDVTGCGNLVEIDREAGVLSIPFGTLTFKNRNETPDPHKPFANQTSEENLKKIADALYRFMEEDSKEHLVDTITIEGHADPHVRGPLFEYANDEASAWRALGTWLVLNKLCGNKLENYRNAKGHAIFGIAGYGSRNCPARGMNETENDYKNRCRRIDIRFIPAPKSNP